MATDILTRPSRSRNLSYAIGARSISPGWERQFPTRYQHTAEESVVLLLGTTRFPFPLIPVQMDRTDTDRFHALKEEHSGEAPRATLSAIFGSSRSRRSSLAARLGLDP